MERSHAQAVMDDLHDALGRRLAVSSLAPCPVEFTAALVNLCSTQSCGKCTPCRVGLSALSDLLADVLEGRADESTLNLIERTARTIYLSSDCAIGYEAGAMALTAIRGFRDDFEHHIREHSCGFDREARVPCVSGCPAHVDIPGYISLVEAGRYADAVKVIRKNNPLPLVCGLVCEHPCEMHCRRGMVDDPMNILALKRFAVEHSDLNDHKPHVVDDTGKRVAVIGGGPAGLSCAYYLAVMGHKVTIFEQRHHMGGMLRYGIPSYRLPRERLQAEIDWILSAGIDVELDHSVNGEELARLRDEFDAVYLAIGAHSDKKLGLPGEEALGVESAVKMLRAIGDDELPDLSGQRVCVIGGGNVAMDVARSAVRCGAEKVSIVYRRRICDMTAQDAEIAGAQAEGCEVLELTAPLAIETGEEGRVSGLRVQPQIIGEPRRGRPAPRAAATPERVIPCERVFVAFAARTGTMRWIWRASAGLWPLARTSIPSRLRTWASPASGVASSPIRMAPCLTSMASLAAVTARPAPPPSSVPSTPAALLRQISTAIWALTTRSSSTLSCRPCSLRASTSAAAASWASAKPASASTIGIWSSKVLPRRRHARRQAAACVATTLALARSAEGGTWNGRAQQNHCQRQHRKRSTQHGQAHDR